MSELTSPYDKRIAVFEARNPCCPKCGSHTVLKRVGNRSYPGFVYKCVKTGCRYEVEIREA